MCSGYRWQRKQQWRFHRGKECGTGRHARGHFNPVVVLSIGILLPPPPPRTELIASSSSSFGCTLCGLTYRNCFPSHRQSFAQRSHCERCARTPTPLMHVGLEKLQHSGGPLRHSTPSPSRASARAFRTRHARAPPPQPLHHATIHGQARQARQARMWLQSRMARCPVVFSCHECSRKHDENRSTLWAASPCSDMLVPESSRFVGSSVAC